MSRDKNEASIRRLDYWSGAAYAFDRALNRVIERHPGMSFYTDEQIEEIRKQMVEDEWFSHQIRRDNRRKKVA